MGFQCKSIGSNFSFTPWSMNIETFNYEGLFENVRHRKCDFMSAVENVRLSEEEIERVMKEAEFHTEEDKKVKERVDSKNGLE